MKDSAIFYSCTKVTTNTNVRKKVAAKWCIARKVSPLDSQKVVEAKALQRLTFVWFNSRKIAIWRNQFHALKRKFSRSCIHTRTYEYKYFRNIVFVVVFISECSEAQQLSERIKRNAIERSALTWNRWHYFVNNNNYICTYVHTYIYIFTYAY